MSLDKQRVGQIVHELLDEADLDQLNTINDICVQQIKQKRKQKINKIKSQISSGDIVEFQGTNQIDDKEGIIKKVKRTRADVIIDGREWDIPISCLVPTR